MSIRRISIYGLIIASYTILSLVMGTMSFWIVQIRIPEVMMLLCLKEKEYVLPLSIGCLVANIIGVISGLDCFPLDFIFGTFGTVTSGLLMYHFRNIRIKDIPVISLLMPPLINGIIIGVEMAIYTITFFDFARTFFIGFIYVFIGEFVSCSLIGMLLLEPLNRAYSALRLDDKKEV